VITSGIENPSKSAVMGRCGGDEKNDRQKLNAKKIKKEKLITICKVVIKYKSYANNISLAKHINNICYVRTAILDLYTSVLFYRSVDSQKRRL